MTAADTTGARYVVRWYLVHLTRTLRKTSLSPWFISLFGASVGIASEQSYNNWRHGATPKITRQVWHNALSGVVVA